MEFKHIPVMLKNLLKRIGTDFILSEITDMWAYKDSDNRNDIKWLELEEKFENEYELTVEDYEAEYGIDEWGFVRVPH